MEFKEIGEFGLIDLIKEGTIVDHKNVVLGIGDDAAVYRSDSRLLSLMSTDMLVEDIHFDLNYTSAFALGYKALAVNLSDIAAMGGTPRHAVVSIAVPKRLNVDFIVELYKGMKFIGKDFGVNIIGGDTVSSRHDLMINVTVVGDVAPEYLQRRDSAKVGDLVVVTGKLGSSAGGLVCLQQGLQEKSYAKELIKEHLMPCPQVKIGQVIAKYASSMNDISDGIASEAKEIAVSSGVGIRLNERCLPAAEELKILAAAVERNYLEFVLYGGEDYQLLFTVNQDRYEALCREMSLKQLTVVGKVTDESGCVELEATDGAIVKIEAKGYNHFR